MDEEIDRLVVAVRADTTGFSSDVATLGASLKTGLGDAADAAGTRIETALARAVTSGKVSFDDLGKVALSVLDSIAEAAVKNALGGSGGGGGLLGGLTSLVSGLFGAPGRATGGPVSPGRAYTVGEIGPELFVPTSAGQVVAAPAASAPRAVNVSITVNGGGDGAVALSKSGKQVARAVRQALQGAG